MTEAHWYVIALSYLLLGVVWYVSKADKTAVDKNYSSTLKLLLICGWLLFAVWLAVTELTTELGNKEPR